MRRRLILSEPAEEDLHRIFDYVQVDDPPAARKLLNRIEASISRLAVFPLSGQVPRDEFLRAKGYRMLACGDYLAFYKTDKRAVTILRIIHGRRDYSFLF